MKRFYVLIQVWEDKTEVSLCNKFLKMTFLCNKYHANHLHVIFGWFVEFRSAKDLSPFHSFIPLKFTCVHGASEYMLVARVLKSLPFFSYGNGKAWCLFGTIRFEDSLTEFRHRNSGAFFFFHLILLSAAFSRLPKEVMHLFCSLKVWRRCFLEKFECWSGSKDKVEM